MIRRLALAALFIFGVSTAGLADPDGPASVTFTVPFPEGLARGPLDGRLLLMLSISADGEPKDQIGSSYRSAQIFGIDVEGWREGEERNHGQKEPIGPPRKSGGPGFAHAAALNLASASRESMRPS